MEKHIVTMKITEDDVPLAAVLKYLRTDEGDDMIDVITAMREEAIGVAVPKALYAITKPDIHNETVFLNGVKFIEPFVAKMLTGSGFVAPYVATCGTEVNDWSKSYAADPYEQFVADTLKQLCLGVVRTKLFD